MAEDSIRPSPELLEVHARAREAIARGDREVLESIFSREACTLFIGSADEEWLPQRETIIDYVLADVELEQAVPDAWARRSGTVDIEVDAWQKGQFGWVTQKSRFEAVSGVPILARATYLFHLEAGQWRCVHVHFSHGVPIESVYGHAGGASLQAIASQVSRDQPEIMASTSGGTTTIAFTDIEGSTEILERLGDNGWMDLLHWHDSVIVTTTEVHGGEVVKTQGDGFMLAFTSATSALDAAIAMQSSSAPGYEGQPVRIRIGIHAGDAVRERSDFFGHAVVVAARVATMALGGEILATQLVKDLVAGVTRFSFGPSRSVELKGIEGPCVVHTVHLT
jgi:class 3 adenylate cyclase